ncbi:MAG: DUF58 domain-containing protein [Litorilinea sp.]
MQFISSLSIDRTRWKQEVVRATRLTRGLPTHATLTLRVRWPLYFLPLVILNQLLTPHPVWIVLFVVLLGLYGAALYWIRQHAQHVTLAHTRMGGQLVVGDTFQDEFEIRNNSYVPVLWAEMVDYSRFPGKKPGQVVACGGNTNYRWRRTVECHQRGVYRLGPYELLLADPFGLLGLQLLFPKEEVIVIYPQIVQLQHGKFPHGQSTGIDRRRRSILGSTPAYSVLDYQPGDSLRRIHWRVTAHRGRLMVRELETEPTGDIWIVLDLWAAAQLGDGPRGTLEFGIVAAASLAASLLSGSEGRGVGLLAQSGVVDDPELILPDDFRRDVVPGTHWHGSDLHGVDGDGAYSLGNANVCVRPKGGAAHLWEILTALAPVQAGPVSLGRLLAGNRELFGPRSTLVVITPHVQWPDSASTLGELVGDYWPADLLHLRSGGLDAHAILITSPRRGDAAAAQSDGHTDTPYDAHADAHADVQSGSHLSAQAVEAQMQAAFRLQELLLAQRVQTSHLAASDAYAPMTTQRRRRTVIRSTPTGGAVAYEVEEDVN